MSDSTVVRGVTFDFPDPNPYESDEVSCPPSWLNLIPQLRAEKKEDYDKDSLEGLADTIEGQGQIHRVRVAMLGPDEVQGYLKHFYDLWEIPEERRKSKDDLKCIRGYYFIVIAGHRRTLAILDSDEPDFVRVTLHPGIDPIRASTIQLVENEYSSPDAVRKAEMIYRLYLLLKKQGEDISKAELADRLNISSGVVYDALNYADMPSVFRDMVEAGLLSYNHVLELHRLKQAGFSQSKLRTYAGLAATGWDDTDDAGLTVSEFSKVVTAQIEERENQQQALFADEPEKADQRNRKVAAKKWVYLARTAEKFFLDIVDALDSGILGEGDCEFLSGSPRRRINGILEAIRKIDNRVKEDVITQANPSEVDEAISSIRKSLFPDENRTDTNEQPHG